jgi:hypothetical protein
VALVALKDAIFEDTATVERAAFTGVSKDSGASGAILYSFKEKREERYAIAP